VNVEDAVVARRSVRGFRGDPVDRAVLERVLTLACRAPSGGNLQPWRVYALTGEPLATLKQRMAERLQSPDGQDERRYEIYPPKLMSPYRERRFDSGEQLYAALRIPRHDKAARRQWFERNFELFGAPVGLFCYIHQRMGRAQWADLGMYLQSVMLLLQEQGLDSCPQEAWSVYHQTVAEVIKPPEDYLLFCGMAIGVKDEAEPANSIRIERAPHEEVVDLRGWGPVAERTPRFDDVESSQARRHC
jgi:nitroreductase